MCFLLKTWDREFSKRFYSNSGESFFLLLENHFLFSASLTMAKNISSNKDDEDVSPSENSEYESVTIKLKQYVVGHRSVSFSSSIHSFTYLQTVPYELEFNSNLEQCREAIRKGVYPQLIPSGSSGE